MGDDPGPDRPRRDRGQPRRGRKRRERAAQDQRVEVLAEQSGNCQIAGRELPAAAALAARVNLTVPLATLLGLASRPGVMSRIGPIDPDHEANTQDRY